MHYDDAVKRGHPSSCARRGEAITTAIVWLLLGAIVNVAVAWGCALLTDQETYDVEASVAAPRAWPAYIANIGWPPPTGLIEVSGGRFGVTILDLQGGDPDADFSATGPGAEKFFVSIEVRRFGVPARSMEWESPGVRGGLRSIDMLKAASAAAGWRQGIDVSRLTGAAGRGRARHLPVMPLWPGFALNTIFYAAIVWLLFAAPFALRRRRRIKRGLCPKCGYNLRGSDASACPECGAAVRPEVVPP